MAEQTQPEGQTNGRYDVWSYRLLVFMLGLVALSAVVLCGWLAAKGSPIPEGLTAIAAAAVGAMAVKLTGQGGR